MWPLRQKPPVKGGKKVSGKKVPAKKVVKRGAKQAQSLIWRRRWDLLIRATSMAVVCFGVVTSIYIWKSGLLKEWMLEAGDTVDRQIAEAGYTVGEVRIRGQKYSTLQQVRTALALYDGQSIVSLDIDEMLRRVEALPWVNEATIVRVMPDALEVTITEHTAAALWQVDEQLFLITAEGHIITDQNVESFTDLPHVVGEGAQQNLAGLLAMKATYPALFTRVKSAIWVGGRRWDLNFHNGVKIKLPEKGSDLAWEQLYQYEDRQKILSKKILMIDLRLHGKTVVRLTPEEVKRRKLLAESGQAEETI
ncbi:cell division protein FtsQ/DivIB [Paremcibacter congregatus]|uniref:Cell division protein FtsQ n=1 Tax=Paremcibacter congregatus TaxID=2043170 RepID=A0A2G4YTN0_9PROT|nr:FtsQ-type POTRA domain-containing protein [Paremcibacter congregatus]PHZ85600.1 hypothetical protein CRD36_02610 [Paremcibacter congregatus]QDE26559.1 FtsQ-type POTRA domain-containing protein [Paremcibacter congregatus]